MSHLPRSQHGAKVRRRRSAHKSPWLLLALLLAIAVAGSIGGYTVDGSVKSLEATLAVDFHTGQTELEAARADLSKAARSGTVSSIDDANLHISAARKAFAKARADVATIPFLSRTTAVPYVGPLVGSVLRLSDMGLALCDAAGDAGAIDRTMATKPANTSGGAGLLVLLKQIGPLLVKVHSDLDRAKTASAGINLSILPAAQRPALVHARASIANGLASVDEFESLLPVINEVLGANGPRNYLLEQLNPAELRPGGGLIGTYSLLRVEGGSVSVLRSGATASLNMPRPDIGQPGYVQPPGPLRDFLVAASWTLADSNYFASFPDNAKAALDFSKIDFNVPVDAVIGIDLYATVDLLKLTGPVVVPETGRTVSAENFVQTLIELGDFGNAGGPAKALVATLSGLMMQKIIALPPQSLPQLLTVLNQAASSRHLQAYFTNQKAEETMTRFGWSGTLNPTGASDFLAEVEGNFGGTKANFFLTRTYQLTLTLNGTTLRHHLVVTLVNRTPNNYPSNYNCYARLFVPTDASGLQDTGLSPPRFADQTSSAGTKQIGGWITVNVNPRAGQGSGQMTFDYDTAWRPGANGEHDLYMQKQPGILSDALSVTWKDGPTSVTQNLALGQDIVIRLSPTKLVIDVGLAGSAHLPGISL